MDDFTKNRLKNLAKFLISLLLALAITFLIKEPEFTDSQVYVLFLLFFAIGLWLTEAIPAFAVSLFIIAFLVFALGHEYFNSNPENIEPYVNTFSSRVIWLLLGGFFLASALRKTQLDKALFRMTLKISGRNPGSMLVGLMSITMMISMLMANGPTTAIMLASTMPLLKFLGKDSGFAKALVLGIPIAATTGGMGTIIGSPPNAIAVGILESNGITLYFVDWMKYGIPLALVLTAVSCFGLLKIYVKDKTPISTDFIEIPGAEPSREMIWQRKVTVVVIIITVGLWLTTSLHGITVTAVCAVPLVVLTVTRVIGSKEIQSLPWDTLLLVAGGLSLGLALENTGLLDHYSKRLLDSGISNTMLVVVLAFSTMIVSNIMSNTAASTVMIPLGMALLVGLETEVALIIALSASSGMFLPVSTPANAVAYSSEFLQIKDFRFGGILIGLLGPLLAMIWVLILN